MAESFRFNLYPITQGVLVTGLLLGLTIVFGFIIRDPGNVNIIVAIVFFVLLLGLTLFTAYAYLLTPRAGIEIFSSGIRFFGFSKQKVVIPWNDIEKIAKVRNLTLSGQSYSTPYGMVSSEVTIIGIYLKKPSDYGDFIENQQKRKIKKLWTQAFWLQKLPALTEHKKEIPDIAIPIANSLSIKLAANIFRTLQNIAPQKVADTVIIRDSGNSSENEDVVDDEGNSIPFELRSQFANVNRINTRIESLAEQAQKEYGEAVASQATHAYFCISIWNNRNRVIKMLLSALDYTLAISGVFLLFVMVFAFGLKTIPLTLCAVVYWFFVGQWDVVMYAPSLVEKKRKLPLIGNMNIAWYSSWMILPICSLFVFALIGEGVNRLNTELANYDTVMVSGVIFLVALYTVGALLNTLTRRKAKKIVANYTRENKTAYALFTEFSLLRAELQKLKLKAYQKNIEIRADF